MEDEIAAWLREQAEADIWRAGKAAGVFMDNPRTEAARAESVLAVLDDYETTWQLAESAWERDEGAHALYDQARTLKRTVRKLAYGYRHREGYKLEEWKP